MHNREYAYNGIFSYFIEEERVFVVEWSNLEVPDEQEEGFQSFQLLLFDPEFYVTPTGDGEILFQYHEFNAVPGEGQCYATVGIRNLDGSGGLQYAYRNQYPPQAVPLRNGTALKFTTTVRNPTGAVRGRVVRTEAPDSGISGAVIDPFYADPETTDAEGWFRFEDLRAANYDHVTITAAGFNPAATAFQVVPGEELVLDPVALTHPVLFIPEQDRELNLDLAPDGHRTRAAVRVQNTGNGPLTFEAEIRYHNGEYPEYDTLMTMHLTPIIDVDRLRCFGVEYIDSLFYITGRSSSGDFELNPQIFVIDFSGEIVRNFRQPTPINDDEAYMKGLTWDGEKLWSAYESFEGDRRLVAFDLEGTLLDTIPYPFDDCHNFAVTYSPQRRSLFVADRGTDILELDMEGNVLNRFEIHFPRREANLSGLGWNPYDIEGMPLYIIDSYHEERGNARPTLLKMDPETGAWRVVKVLHRSAERTKGYYGIAMVHNHDLERSYLAIIEGLGLWRDADDRLRIHEIGPNISFMVPGSFVNQTGEVAPRFSLPTGFEIDATGLPQDDYTWSYRISHNGAGEAAVVPVTLTVSNDAGFEEEPRVARDFNLKGAFPNPFNRTVKITFDLDRSQPVKLRVFDLSGREAALLLDETPAAGVHNVIWDASGMPSGLYLLQLEASGKVSSAKVVLMK